MIHYAYLYDSETPYITKLGGYLSINSSFPFIVKVCVTIQELQERLKTEKPKLLLISECDKDVLEECKCEETIFLSANKSGNHNGNRYINKYQSGEKIVKDILGFVAESDSMSSIITRKCSMKILSFYTPIKRSLSTTMCIAMGQLLSKKAKTLYINFECFSGLNKLLNCEFQKNIGDLLFYLNNQNQNPGLVLSGIVENRDGLDILPPFNNQMDLINIRDEIWIRLFEIIERETDYEYLLLDLSDSVQGLFDILKLSDKVITSVDNDEVAIFKLTQYEECLRYTGYEEVLEKTKKCNVPHQHRRNGEINFLGFGELGDYVRTILQGVIDETA